MVVKEEIVLREVHASRKLHSREQRLLLGHGRQLHAPACFGSHGLRPGGSRVAARWLRVSCCRITAATTAAAGAGCWRRLGCRLRSCCRCVVAAQPSVRWSSLPCWLGTTDCAAVVAVAVNLALSRSAAQRWPAQPWRSPTAGKGKCHAIFHAFFKFLPVMCSHGCKGQRAVLPSECLALR